MKVALRDDDTSYFTSPERLEAVYHDVWDRLPVALAVVPHAMGFADKAIPEAYWQAGRAFPLEENPAMVSRLRELAKAGRVTIAQHGFTHEDFPDGHEFQAAPDLETRLARGRAYLEQLIGVRIALFVPPHNALSKRGLAAVDEAGLHVLGLDVAIWPPSFRTLAFSVSKVVLSACSPDKNRVSPPSMTSTLRNICRTMTSTCLSLIPTPCNR